MDVVRGQLRFRGESQAKTVTATTTGKPDSTAKDRAWVLQLDDGRVSEIAPIVFVSSWFLPRKPST